MVASQNKNLQGFFAVGTKEIRSRTPSSTSVTKAEGKPPAIVLSQTEKLRHDLVKKRPKYAGYRDFA